MQLLECNITGFGKLRGLTETFGPGINLIYGKNEAGKSTLHTFLWAMLFGLSPRVQIPKKRGLYDRMEPWGEDMPYGGSLRFSHEGKTYCIKRDFTKGADDLIVTDETSGMAVPDPAAFLQGVLCGLSEAGYVNTISIGQLGAAADGGMGAELKRFIRNLSSTGSADLSADAALSYLEKRRAEIADHIDPDAAKSYAHTVSEIKKLEEELARPENENALRTYTGLQDEMGKKAADLSARHEAAAEKRKKAEAVLSENGFTDETSVREFQEETEELYENCLALSGKLGGIPLACALLLGGVLFWYLFGTGLLPQAAQSGAGQNALAAPGAAVYSFLAASGISAAACCALAAVLGAACIAGAAMILFKRSRNQRELAAAEEELSDRLQRHVGTGEISDNAMAGFTDRMNGFVKLAGISRKTAQEQEALSHEIVTLSAEQNLCREKLDAQRNRQREVERRLVRLHSLHNAADEFRRVVGENQRLKEETDAIAIAEETLTSLAGEIAGSLGTYLNAEAGQLIHNITGGAYTSMDIGNGLDIRLNTKDGMVPVSQVSHGTMDQIYLAVRLAAVRMIGGAGDPLPLFFDDSFVLYDSERLSHALSFLSENYQGQILIFTCHGREESLLSAQETPYKLICLPDAAQHLVVA